MTGFYLKTRGVLAFGLANRSDSTFIVCAGSNIRNQQAGNMVVYRRKAFVLRKELLRKGVISSGLVFLSSYEFKNISMATSVILGGSRSGDKWVNAEDQTYPEWMGTKKLTILFKKGSRFITNSNETFLVRDVVENRDENNERIYEYLLRPSGGTKADDILVPEHEVIRSLRSLIREEMR